MNDPVVEEIKLLYKGALKEEEEAEAKVRGMAFNIGKIRGFLAALEILDEVISSLMEEVQRDAVQEMEAKRIYFDSVQEKKPEDYENFSKEIEAISSRMKSEVQLLQRVQQRVKELVEAEKQKTMSKIRGVKEKEEDP